MSQSSKQLVINAENIIKKAAYKKSLENLNDQFGLNLVSDSLDSSTPSSSSLNNILNNIGKAKSSTSIVSVPKQPQDYELTLINNVQLLESYIATLTGIVMYNKHPAPYNLANSADACDFVISTANDKNFVMTGGTVKDIPMYLPGMQTSTQQQTINATSVTLHVQLLKALFGSMNLPSGVLNQFDGILTDTANTLKDLNLSFATQTESLDHVVTYYYLSPVAGTKPIINEMRVRFIYLKINQESWKTSIKVGKHGSASAEHFSFDVGITTTEAVMNSELVSNNQSNITNALSALTKNTPKGISKATNMQGVTY